MTIIKNPFPAGGYRGPDYFCDREKETLALRRNMENGLNTTFISHRRMGKTAVIHHLFYQFSNKKDVKCIYTDLYATQNLKDFTGQMAEAIYKAFPEKQSAGKKFIKLLKSLSPVLSFDSLSGQPEIHFEYSRASQYEHSITSLFEFLEGQKAHILFAFDEFQQVAKYPEKNTEALLRTNIQNLNKCSFIFSGSNRHLMNQVFNNQKRPFFCQHSNAVFSCNTCFQLSAIHPKEI